MNPDTLPAFTPNPSPPSLNTRRLALVLVAGAALIILVVVIIITQSSSSKKTANTSSGNNNATLAPTPTPTPLPSNSALAPAPTPAITNTDSLTTDVGFTSEQMQDLQYTFGKFAQAIGTPGASISVNGTSINVTTPNSNDPNASAGLTATFTIVVNSKTTYNVSTFLSTPTAVATTITSTTGATLYSSGTVDLYNGIGDN